MSDDRKTSVRDLVKIDSHATATAEGRRDRWDGPSPASGLPNLRVRTIERTAIVRFEDAEIVFDEADVQAIGEQIRRLINDEGHTRLLLNFGGVRYISSDVLGILAGLQKKLDPAYGRIQLCGLDRLLRDMVRIAHLEQVFDVCDDEAEALGLLIR